MQVAESNYEQQRLAALHQYDLLDTPSEECFDRIAALTARVFNTPICLVSLVDRDRVWFKSKYGLDLDEVPRQGAFCNRSINSDKVQVVEDTWQDELTACSELVAGPLNIRFSASAPLIDPDGYRLGTLCILDTKPRSLNFSERQNLVDLCYLVMDQIRLRYGRIALLKEKKENDKLCEKLADKKRLESLGVLVGGLAHDLNNLLVPVVVNSELIQAMGAHDAEITELASEIALAGDRAAELCAQLLAYAGRRKSARTRVCLSRVIEHSIKMLRDSVGNVVVDLRFTNNAKPSEVEADVTGLSQVFYNVMRNAWDARAEKQTAVEVELYDATAGRRPTIKPSVGNCLSTNQYVAVRIRDYGHGIDPEVVPQIFEPFFTTKEAAGTGLGLAASAGIIKSHAGVIYVDSQPGQGTTFDILIPNGRVETGSEDQRPAVLVVDAEPIVCRTVAMMLNQIGFRPLIANSTEQALELLQEHGSQKISCVILDLSSEHAVELGRNVRDMKPEVPIILSGGADASGMGGDIFEWDRCPIIRKPFSFEQFRRVIQLHARRAPLAA